MRVLVIGADGFIGRAVSRELRAKHEVVAASRYIVHGESIDLLNSESIAKVLKKVRPDAIINCAGIVENSEQSANNPNMTKNLLEQVAVSGLPIQRIIILGSAAEYGLVDKLPVAEDVLRQPTSSYGTSKKQEIDTALWYKEEKHLPIVVARIFNPVGLAMPPRTLLPSITRQIDAYRAGETDHIEVDRLDAGRDYFDISVVGRAIALLLSKTAKYAVYNIGSGVTTTNRQLIDAMLAESGLVDRPRLIETSDTQEPLVASQADISRFYKEFGWKPQKNLTATLKSFVKVNILIIGSGSTGEMVAKNIVSNKESAFNVVGFIDDEHTQGKEVQGIPVLGTIAELKDIVRSNGIEEILIATASERGVITRRVIENTIGLKLEYKILPRLAEVLLQKSEADYSKLIRNVEIEDVLGGEILKNDEIEISDYAKNQTILITGAAGSIGSELSRQIVAHKAQNVVLFDWWENGIFELRNQLLAGYPSANITYIIGDVKDRKKLNRVMDYYRPNTVFHAAAYKHVPLMEDNPAEAVKNNIVGTKTVAEVAIKYGVSKFVLVSTDKAVNPTNIMGATKRAAEKMIHILSQSQSTTTFSAVRFGNVINSNGSAIPYFERQIEAGGPVTITHKDITRFFMTIPEAVHLILQTWVMGENDDLFVLDMGEPVKIYDLARLLVAMRGYIPEEEIKFKIIGLRPGEKLYEEVLAKKEETTATTVKKIFRTKNYMNFDKFAYLYNLSVLVESLEENDLNVDFIKDSLKEMISTYHPKD